MLRTCVRTALSALTATVVAALVAGCGYGANPGTKHVSVEVTSGFGAQVVGRTTQTQVPGSETVLSLLKGRFAVSSRDGQQVGAIDGHGGGSGHRQWFYFVNGIQAPMGAARTDVHKGDHIWWDLHDRTATETVPAVVGSYPEPFTNGISGKEFPTLLSCAPEVQGACDTVGGALRRVGVKAADQVFGTGSGSESLAVVVGTWNEIRGVVAAEMISGGPTISGVYGQFVGAHAQALELDGPSGAIVDTLHGSVGLIAATGLATVGEPTWLVTGTDVAGVMAAARAFTAKKLHNHFAVAVSGSQVIPIPVLPRQ
jgi:hypothetical protein